MTKAYPNSRKYTCDACCYLERINSKGIRRSIYMSCRARWQPDVKMYEFENVHTKCNNNASSSLITDLENFSFCEDCWGWRKKSDRIHVEENYNQKLRKSESVTNSEGFLRWFESHIYREESIIGSKSCSSICSISRGESNHRHRKQLNIVVQSDLQQCKTRYSMPDRIKKQKNQNCQTETNHSVKGVQCGTPSLSRSSIARLQRKVESLKKECGRLLGGSSISTEKSKKKLALDLPVLSRWRMEGESKERRLQCIPFAGTLTLTIEKGSRSNPFNFGQHGSGIRTSGEVQDFYKIRDYHLSTGTLFEDTEFPPNDSSLFYSKRPDRYYEWKRPSEIADNPKLFVEGYSRFDVQQGELGDCWLLAAVANLTMHRRLFFQVVPTDQDFEEKYAGVFHFRFWQYGKWIDVVIDDRLPTYQGQLVFLHSTEDNEFWSALLEKAYAKLHGSYEALKGGSTCEAMEDFTGGVTEMYEMKASPPNLFKIVLKAYERSSMMGCSLEPDPNVLEAETPEGLIRGHAYSITQVKYVDIRTPNTYGKIPLLRLRNPWGNETEWNGPWSDKSPEWRFIPDEEKEELGLTFDDDGEFWMSFKDFQTHFDRLEICNLTPDSLTEEELVEGHKKKWEMSIFEGEWVRGVTAGGCRNYLETFWLNPQYRVTLTDPDDDDDENRCTMIVALMQKNRRSKRNMGMEELTIGFAIYHLPYPDHAPKPLDMNFFKYNASVARSPSFINLREVSCRFKLPTGTYCIIPSTFDPNEEGEFLLRVFSEHKNYLEYGSYYYQ